MTGSKLDICAILRTLPLLRQLDDFKIAALVVGTHKINVARGEMLFRKGDFSHGFYIIVYGQIKLAFPSLNTDKVVEVLGAGQSFGEAVMFMEKPYPVYAQALTDTLLLHLSRQVLFQAIEQDPMFAREMLAGLSMRLHTLIQDVESYSLQSGTQRIIGYLLQHENAGTMASNQVEFRLPANKNVIASRLNVSPETLSRVFHALIDANLISVDGRLISIHDMEQLRGFGI